MKLRTVAVAMLLILALAGMAIAQTSPDATGKEGKGKRPGGGARIVKELGLNEQQAGQVRDIVKKFHVDVAAVLKANGSKEEKEAKIVPLRKTAADAINALLTKEQQEKAKTSGIIDRALAVRKPDGAKLKAVFEQLNLTPEQKTKIEAIEKTAADAVKAVKADTALTDEQKQTKIRELRKQANKDIMAVLTPEQQQKFKDLMKPPKSPAGA